MPPHIGDLHGAVVVAHDTEPHYLKRVQDRIETALRQLSDRDDCWVALWWSNGAPAIAVRQAFTEIDLPKHVLGIMLVGATVAVPSAEIHYYDIILPRKELDEREIEPPVLSLKDTLSASRSSLPFNARPAFVPRSCSIRLASEDSDSPFSLGMVLVRSSPSTC
ncbi:MAG: hypothetical protein QOF06_1851 [Solirubrobacterales bacterium]|nr:hypothetical protein [Solirubrobacterales bacterium]